MRRERILKNGKANQELREFIIKEGDKISGFNRPSAEGVRILVRKPLQTASLIRQFSNLRKFDFHYPIR